MTSERELNRQVDRLLERVVFGCHTRKKPGDLIMRLPKYERELVKQLTSKHFNHRIK
jgi:hypothetical protein